jgi:class 3 adenylate cyclase
MVTCATCGRENPTDARFCNGCGAPLEVPAAQRREERKIVTVLFADLVGFTSRAERLDPEDVRALLAPYWQHLRDDLERFGGTVEKFIGDAVMALFGAPVAHEDDPERAVRAALAIRDWVRESGEDLQVRIAVNTGEALVLLGARPGEGEGMAAGDVVNTAARLQTAAPVNGVLVGEATYRATRHAIEYEAHEPVTAKGKSEPLAVWEAIEARARATIEALSSSSLVGRDGELDLLVGALQRARRDRQPQLVTVAGVPGIGKSRLVAELYAAVDAEDELIAWRRGRSLPYGEDVSLWALGEIVKAELGVFESDAAEETGAKLGRALAELLEDEGEREWIGRHLAPLVGLPAEELDASESPAAWRRWLELLAERRPLVLVFEDLQWGDDELLGFVEELVDWIAGVPLLVVCTARPELYERRPGWAGGKRNAFAISLGPLDDADTARVLAAALDQTLLPAETQAALLERAGGNPLYAEQYARMLAEGADPEALPETVQGIVAARLDLLAPEEKSLLQEAAVLGRAFWPGAVGADDERLRGLVRKEFVRRERRSSIAGETEYAFAHALVRDVAYGQIPRASRAEKHRRAAEWISSLPADRAVDRSALLAHHYAAALELAQAAGLDLSDLHEPARHAFADAGRRALSLSGHAAAARFLSQALELWPAGDAEHASLLLARSAARSGAGDFSGSVADAEAALELVAGDPEQEANAAITVAQAYWLAGRGVEGAGYADRALELVRGLPDSPVKAVVLVQRARLFMLFGDRSRAVELASEGLALIEALGVSQELEASALIVRGTARWDENRLPDLEKGVEVAKRGRFISTLHRGLNNLADAHYRRGDLDAAMATVERLRDVDRQYGYTSGLFWIDADDSINEFVLGRWERALELAESVIVADLSGERHVLTANCYLVRGYIRHARGVPGASEDLGRAAEYARQVGDLQFLAPALCAHARLIALEGDRAGARRVVEEVLEAYAQLQETERAWAAEVAWAFVLAGEPAEYRALLERNTDRPSLWVDAALAVTEGDFAVAADIYGAMGARTSEAEARVHAARALHDRGDRAGSQAQLARAVSFYREVGAARLIRDAEALLPASA